MIKVRPIHFWSHKVLPLVYDDALSYYEVLCKVIGRFNEIVEVLNEMGEEIALLNPEKVEEMLTEIRASIEDLTERVTNGESSIQDIETRLAQVEEDTAFLLDWLTNLSNNHNALVLRMYTAEGKITTLEADDADLKSRMTTAEGNITTLQSDVADLKSRMTIAEGNIIDHNTRLTNQLTMINGIIYDVQDLQAKTPSVAFIPVSGGIRVQMDNASAIALADQNLGRPVAVVNSGTLTGGDASDAVEWIEAVLEAKENGKIIQIYSPDYAYLTEVCYYKHSDSWIELNFSRPAFEDLTYHYDYNMGYFIDFNATNPNAVSYKVTNTACATRFST